MYSLHQDAAEEAGARAEVIASRHDELDERAEVVAADEAPSTRAASNVSRLWVGGQRTAPQRAQRAMYVQDSLCTRGCLRYPMLDAARTPAPEEAHKAAAAASAIPVHAAALPGLLVFIRPGSSVVQYSGILGWIRTSGRRRTNPHSHMAWAARPGTFPDSQLHGLWSCRHGDTFGPSSTSAVSSTNPSPGSLNAESIVWTTRPVGNQSTSVPDRFSR